MDEEKLTDTGESTNVPGDIPRVRSIIVVPDLIRKIVTDRTFLRSFKVTVTVLASIISALVLFTFVLYFVPFLSETVPVRRTVISNDSDLKKDASYKKEISTLSRELRGLSAKYGSYTSGQSYIVINTTKNRFSLYRNRKLLREGVCSSGSYTRLETAEGDRKWVFKTPKGKYRIQGKIANPVWRKPDWAFVEEGLPVPSATDNSRYEYGVLGDYALSIGDGYLIHGTIYQRLLGMPVTHGCVRLNDEDLKAVFNTLNIGSRVYIF